MASDSLRLALAAGGAALLGTAGAAFIFRTMFKETLDSYNSDSDSEESDDEPDKGQPSDKLVNKKRQMIKNIARTNSLRRQVSGFSLEEAKERNQLKSSLASDKHPRQVMSELQKGNTRFWMGVSKRVSGDAFERRALIMNQFPQVAVLGCSDSRVPTEIVFDQGLGEMFVVRVAGNCMSKSTSASLEYAVHNLKVKVLIVMGHEACGAIKASLRSLEEIEKEPENLASALKAIKAGLDVDHLANAKDSRAYDREAVITNIYSGLTALTKDESVMKRVRDRDLILVGCFYEISSGIVDFLKEISYESLMQGANTGRLSLPMT